MKRYARFASIDVDPTNGFTELCPNELPVPDALSIVPEMNFVGKKVDIRVLSRDAHTKAAEWQATSENPQLSEITDAPDMDVRWNIHSVAGTFGGQLIDGLPHVRDYDFVVWKGIEPDMHPYSAIFHDLGKKLSTGVIEKLHYEGITDVIVNGLATEYCVMATAIDLHAAKFKVALYLPACRGISADGVEKAIETMSEMGITILRSQEDLCAHMKVKP